MNCRVIVWMLAVGLTCLLTLLLTALLAVGLTCLLTLLLTALLAVGLTCLLTLILTALLAVGLTCLLTLILTALLAVLAGIIAVAADRRRRQNNLSTHLAQLAVMAVEMGSSTLHQLLLSEVISCMSVRKVTAESRSLALADDLSSRSLATVERDSCPPLRVSALTQRGRST